MDDGELWSFLRDVLSAGGILDRSSQGEPYERYAQRLDALAREYADKLRGKLARTKEATP